MPNTPAASASREQRSKQPRLVLIANRKTWAIYDPISRRRASTGTANRAEAEGILAAYLREPSPNASPKTVADVLDAYLQACEADAKPGTERKRWAHKAIKRHLGHRLPETLGDADATAYRAARAAEGVKPWTVRTEMQAALAAFRWAASPKRRLTPSTPDWDLPAQPPGRTRWLTRDEANRLIAAAKVPHVALFIKIALGTCARKSAILGLTWDRVDFERGTIDMREPGRAPTNKRRTIVRMNDSLAAALREAHARRTCPFVVAWAGRPVASVKTGFREAARGAGLADATPHVLKHTAVTWLLQAGVSVWEVAGFAATTPAVISRVYGHHSPDYQRAAAEALDLGNSGGLDK